MPLLLALLVLGVILYLLGWVSKADAGRLASWIRKSSGVLFVAGAAFITTRNIGVAILAAMLAYSAFSKFGWVFGGVRRPSGGTVSTVRTAYLEMSLDHATGAMAGKVLRGRFAGRSLSELSQTDASDLLAEFRSNDPQAAQLYEAYLDRLSPGWAGARTSGSSNRAGTSRAMGVEEAYLVLGLNPGASREDVQAAHRNLMKRFHPDQGGSTYIAAKVNEAKDVLLKHIKV